jgi:hypothetical protein
MPLLVHVTGLHILQFQVIGVKTKHKLGVNLTHKICHVILTNAIRLVFVFILNQTRAIIDFFIIDFIILLCLMPEDFTLSNARRFYWSRRERWHLMS